jgi:hypothetical protein
MRLSENSDWQGLLAHCQTTATTIIVIASANPRQSRGLNVKRFAGELPDGES